MASDAYWNATKPNGMPDHVWKAQQEAAKKKAEEEAAAKKKAEEEAKKKAEEIKKAAEESAKKAVEDAVNSLLNGTYVPPGTVTVPQEMVDGYNKYQNEKVAEEVIKNLEAQEEAKKNNTSSNTASKPNGTSTNDARAEQMAIKNNTTPDYSKDYTGNANNTSSVNSNTHSSGSARIPNSTSTGTSKPNNTGLTTEDARDEKVAIKNNTTPDYAQKETGNAGLTTEDARKEHIGTMKNPAINSPTDGQISAGATTPVTNSGAGSNPAPSTGSSNSSSSPSSPSSSSSSPSNSVPSSTPTANTVKTPAAEEMASYVSTIIKAAKEKLGGVKEPVYLTKHMGSDELITKPDAPALRTLEELAKTFGITYDYDSIYKILNDSVDKQYDAIYARQKQNEDAYYDNASAAQNTLLDTLSRDRSSAVQAGVSKGMQAANALGAMLGVSQQFANNATALSQERGNTAKDYGAALAKAVVDAETTSNERKNAIMEISKMLYGYDSEQYVANMDNYNTILTNNAALQQSYMNNHTALQNALASIFGGVANNKIMGDANVQSSTLAAEAQKAAAQYAAAAQQYAAQQSYLSNQAIADANRDAANVSANTQALTALLQAGLLDANEVKNATGGSGTGTGTSSSSPSTAQNWLDLLAKVAYNTQSGSTNNMYYK